MKAKKGLSSNDLFECLFKINSKTINLLDLSTVSHDTRMIWSSGKPYKDSQSINADFSDCIEVEEKSVYICTQNIFAACFDGLKNYLGVYDKNSDSLIKGQCDLYNSFEIPLDTKYIRICTFDRNGLSIPFDEKAAFYKSK